VFRLAGDLTFSEQQIKWAKRAVTDSFSDPSNKFLSQRTSSYGIFTGHVLNELKPSVLFGFAEEN